MKMTCPHCSTKLEIPDEFSGQKGTCKHCGKAITAPTKPVKDKTARVLAIIMGVFFLAAGAIHGIKSSLPDDSQKAAAVMIVPTFTKDHQDAALAALKKEGHKVPSSLKLDRSFIVTEFQFPDGLIPPPERLAKEILLVVRNSVYPMAGADTDWCYRVTLYGKSPGPELVNVYGSARFCGGGITWDGPSR